MVRVCVTSLWFVGPTPEYGELVEHEFARPGLQTQTLKPDSRAANTKTQDVATGLNAGVELSPCDVRLSREVASAHAYAASRQWDACKSALLRAESLVACSTDPVKRSFELAELSRDAFEPKLAERLYLAALKVP